MSYILDALRKAERDRQLTRVPTLVTAHGSGESARRLPWTWAVGVSLALSAIIASSLFWASGRPAPLRETAPPPSVAPDASSSSARTGSGTMSQSVERAPEPEARVAPRAPAPAIERPAVERAPGAPVRSRTAHAAPPAAPPRAAHSAGDPRGAQTVARASAAPETPGPTAASPRPAPPAAASVESPSHIPAPAQPAAAAASAPPPAAPAVASASAPAPAGPVAAATSAPPAAAPLAGAASPPTPAGPIAAASPPTPASPVAAPARSPAPVPDVGPGRAGQPAPPQPLARLTLDVLVYSEVPAERLVFINGRKYIEGQTVDGEAVLEQITPAGVVLRHQGRQYLLQPKLNPYLRSASP
jgi:hypothetical protein